MFKSLQKSALMCLVFTSHVVKAEVDQIRINGHNIQVDGGPLFLGHKSDAYYEQVLGPVTHVDSHKDGKTSTLYWADRGIQISRYPFDSDCSVVFKVYLVDEEVYAQGAGIFRVHAYSGALLLNGFPLASNTSLDAHKEVTEQYNKVSPFGYYYDLGEEYDFGTLVYIRHEHRMPINQYVSVSVKKDLDSFCKKQSKVKSLEPAMAN